MRFLVLAAVLVPVSTLYVQVHRATAQQLSFAERERHGVAYLASLWQLTLALTDAQAAAVAGGRPGDPDTLPQAVAATGRVDERLGDELRTHNRWAALRTTIESLPDRTFTDAAAAYTAYTEAAEMLLALTGKVRESSQLIRDPDPDTYYLEDAGAEELPETTVAAGRLADLTLVAPTRPQAERTNTIATLAVVRTAVTDPADDLTNDLRSAVDSSESRTLSGNLLGRLDLFQRSIEKFAAVSAPGAAEVAPDPAPVRGARTELQHAAADLGEAIYTELDGLIAARMDDLENRQRLALAALALAILLVLTPVAAWYVRHRRTGPGEQPPAGPHPPAGRSARRSLASTLAGPSLPRPPSTRDAQSPDVGDAGRPGWGRSGVPR